MGANRVFFPQEALDQWLEEERITLEGETMTLIQEGQQFQLETAVRFLTEVAEGGDELQLVGKVKSIAQMGELEAEHCADSVVLGDNAYEVVEGFVGELVQADQDVAEAQGDSLANATRAAVGEADPRKTLDPLTRFFTEK